MEEADLLAGAQEMEEEFQFLLCERCQKEPKNPKLLGCLHTVCLECLEESKPIGQCPVCRFSVQGGDRRAFQDNLLFAGLQAKMDTYRKIASSRDLVCEHCKDEAHFWCAECSEFLCVKCYKAHQWYLKRKSHEPQRLGDLKNQTAWNFLEEARKSSNLLCSEHSQNLSVYCHGCRKPLCCSCAMLDSEHYNAKLYCDIRMEIENRKEQLVGMKQDLEEKTRDCHRTYSAIQERLQQLEKERDEIQAYIQKKVEEMTHYIQQKGQELLERVERHHGQKSDDVEKKLRNAEQIMKRMQSGQRLVEKMNLFASDQEMIEMHPFIVESLEELKRQKLPSGGFRIPMGNFADIKDEVRTLFRRVKGSAGATRHAPPAAPVTNSDVSMHGEKSPPRSQEETVVTSTPMKRLAEKFVQASPKLLKLESRDCDTQDASRRHTQEGATMSWRSPNHISTPDKEQKEPGNPVEVLDNSPSGVCESETISIVISSSEENEDDM